MNRNTNIKCYPNQINLFRLKKQNVYRSKSIDNLEDMHSLFGTYIGIHAARIGKPYISLLNKGVNVSPQIIFETVNGDNNFITLRSMRRTLHIANIDDAPMLFHATRSIRIPAKAKTIKGDIILKSREILREKLQEGYAEYPCLCAELGSECNIDVDMARLLIKYHWENGLLCLKNVSTSVYHERRAFGLTQECYNLDLESSSKDEEDNAIYELICRYIRGFGPVSLVDIIWWTGLSPQKVKKVVNIMKNRELVEVTTYSFPKTELYLWADELHDLSEVCEEEPWCKFMSYEDSALKGYKETRYLYSEKPERLFNAIGEIYPTIIVNGKCVGFWSIDFKTERLDVIPLDKSHFSTFNELIKCEKKRMENLMFTRFCL